MCNNDFFTKGTERRPEYRGDSRGSQMRPPEQAGPRGAGERAGLPASPSVLCDALDAGNPRRTCPEAAPQVPHQRVSAALGGFLAAPGSLKEQQMVSPSFTDCPGNLSPPRSSQFQQLGPASLSHQDLMCPLAW